MYSTTVEPLLFYLASTPNSIDGVGVTYGRESVTQCGAAGVHRIKPRTPSLFGRQGCMDSLKDLSAKAVVRPMLMIQNN